MRLCVSQKRKASVWFAVCTAERNCWRGPSVQGHGPAQFPARVAQILRRPQGTWQPRRSSDGKEDMCYGRKEQEAAWKRLKLMCLYQLVVAAVRVPEPFGFFNGVLLHGVGH